MTAVVSSTELIGQSVSITALRQHVSRLLGHESEARRLPPLLLEGETGTGKGLLARWIHGRSSRAAAPFVDINCAAIPETLLEAELFGFERGAFTDARHAKPGLFQAAHRGVVFLDEVGLLPDGMQGKLLKAIEERVVRRLGSVESEPTDVWIIAATSDDLRRSTRERRFREDLYHRLAALTFRLPPLRERGEDVLLLAEHFLARACADYRLPVKTLDADARQALLQHAWPGNVRELANVMERVALLTDERRVTAAALDLPDGRPTPHSDHQPAEVGPLREAMDDVERRRIVQVLTETGGNISRAAARLGMPRSTLRYRLEKHGVQASPAPLPRDAAMHAADRTDAREDAAGLARPVDWQRRHLALLQVALASSADRPSMSREHRLLDDVLAKVQSFGGRLEEQGPAGFVALFGFETVEDACTRATHAALAVQNAIRRARQTDSSTPAVTCALHAGDLLAGYAGTGVVIDMHDRHRARTVLEALAAGGEKGAIVVSESAAPLLERRFDLERVSATSVVPGPLYRVLGRESTGYGLAGRPLTPFVGRAREMALLDGVRARVSAGHGQVVALVGEPGVGKSRITYELAHAATERGWLALEGHAASYGAATPYLPLADLLRRYFRLDDAEGPRAVHEKIRGRVSALPDHRLGTIVAPLLAVLGGHVDDDEWQRLDPPQRRERILDGIKRLLLRESERQPLIVLFEDLHWIDAGTQAFFDRLVEALPTARILLLVNYRPEYRHGWGNKTYYRQLQIDPLPPLTSEALLDALLGGDSALTLVKRLVIERSEGNPFFIEESVRSLVETGVLAGERGAYRMTRVVQELNVPATVEAMLAARIDRLAVEDKHLLQIASVIGKDVPFAVLQIIADSSHDDLRRGLERLQTAEFLYEAGLSPELGYCFKHALTQEVTYSGLSPARRRELHAQIVDAIEAVHRDRLDEQIERLAHHALRGELREKAVAYLRQAGLKAAARSAPQDARVWLEQALYLLEALPQTRSALEQACDVRLELRPVMQQLGEGRRMLERLREAEALAEQLNDDGRRGRVCALATNDHSRLGELDEALVAGARALEIAGRLGDLRLRILTTSFVAQTHYYRGEYQRAVELATANLASLPDDWLYDHLGNIAPASVYDRACLVRSLAELGRFTEAAAYESEANRIAESTQHAFTIGVANWAAGTLSVLKGDWAKAHALIEHEIAVLRAGNVMFLLHFAVASSAWVLAQLGEATEALMRLREADGLLERVAARGRVGHRAWADLSLGRACLLLGRLEDARRLADRAVASSQSQRGFAAHALLLLADVMIRPERFDAATGEATYRQALALAEPRGMGPVIAHCHAGLAMLYRRMRKPQHADEHFTTAMTRYEAMGMTFWLEKAEREPRDLA